MPMEKHGKAWNTFSALKKKKNSIKHIKHLNERMNENFKYNKCHQWVIFITFD